MTQTPIGIAKDGRIIYGPYKSDGTTWQPCDVDVCNGRRSNANYFYVSSMFYPYFVGCWGPGNMATVAPRCTSNPRICGSGAPSLINGLFIAVASIAAVLFAF